MGHPEYFISDKCLDEIAEVLDADGLLFEQVYGFCEVDGLGSSPLQRLCEKLRRRFPGVQAILLELESSVWVEVPRTRVYICSLSAQLGGEEGVAEWLHRVNEA